MSTPKDWRISQLPRPPRIATDRREWTEDRARRASPSGEALRSSQSRQRLDLPAYASLKQRRDRHQAGRGVMAWWRAKPFIEPRNAEDVVRINRTHENKIKRVSMDLRSLPVRRRRAVVLNLWLVQAASGHARSVDRAQRRFDDHLCGGGSD